MDVGTYILANYATAKEVKDDIDSGKLQLVWNQVHCSCAGQV